MLEINDLCFSYGARSKKAVDELKLKVEPGNICALLGPNGAGKTTIIKLILGLLKADAGSVRIDGKDIYSDSVSYKASIGYVSDEQDIYNNLTGKEYLEFIADAYKVSTEERKVIYERLLNLFHMQNRLNEKNEKLFAWNETENFYNRLSCTYSGYMDFGRTYDRIGR